MGRVAKNAPLANKTAHTDLLFGEVVADPYRWLEDSESEATRAWTQAQNERALAYVRSAPCAPRFRARVKELLAIGYAQSPVATVGQGGACRYFHTRRAGDQVQPVLLVREALGAEDRVLVDVAALSADGTDALDWWFPSPDGALLAWGRSEKGSEESTLFLRDVTTGRDTGESIPHTRFGSVAWVSRDRFFYTRHPAPGTVPEGEEQYHSRVYEHVVGREHESDPCVFGEGRDKTDAHSVTASPSGRYVVVRVHRGWERSEVYVLDRERPELGFRAVAVGSDALFEPIAKDDALYLLTNEGAPHYLLLKVRYDALEERTVVIAENADVLTTVAIAKEGILASYLSDASSRVFAYGRGGRLLREIDLPSLGSADVSALVTGEVFVDFTSFVVPFESLRLEGSFDAPESLRLAPWDSVSARGAASDVTVTRLFARSKDGTAVPLFVVSKPSAAAGPRPTVLYGYGGFNVNLTPAFSARALALVEQGGVWASAVLRGGGEYGESWHRAGMLENKQRVFDDCYACGEELVRRGIATPDRLGVIGGSNGGLLAAVAAVQRPELFRAAVSLVPLCDMLRYHLFRLGAFWIPEYGSPDEEAAYRYLRAYSPYHNVRDGTRYPAVLLTTAESDSRVDPMHARKMAARLMEVEENRDVLLHVESRAGHGQGKPTTKLEEDLVMQLSFLWTELAC